MPPKAATPKREATEIKDGSIRLPIYPMADGRWCVVVRESKKGPRKRVLRKTLAEAKEFARDECTRIANGRIAADELTPQDRVETVAAKKALQPLGLSLDAAARDLAEAHKISGGAGVLELARFWARHHQSALSRKTVPQVHAEMMEDYRGHELNPRYKSGLVSFLGKFARKFATRPIGEVTKDEIRDFLRDQPGNWRTHNGRLSLIITLFNFAKTNKHLPQDRDTEADAVKRIPRPRGEHGRPGVLSADELREVLAHVGAAWLPFVALGAFAGLRRSEIEQLDWSDVRWEEKLIHVRSEVAKNTRRLAGDERFVPMREQLLAWLHGYRDKRTGPVCTRTRFEDELNRLRTEAKNEDGKVVRPVVIQGKWPKNALRHTYGSCRCSEAKNMPLVAEEMGNSVPVLKRDYRNPRTDREVAAWASIYPAGWEHSNVVVAFDGGRQSAAD